MGVIYLKPGEEVLVTDGVFKGVRGIVEGFETEFTTSADNPCKAKVRVDYDNTVLVSTSNLKKTNEDYIILVTNRDKTKLKVGHNPYIINLSEREINDHLVSLYNKVHPNNVSCEFVSPFDLYYLNDTVVSATPTSAITSDFKIEGLDVSVSQLKAIINYLD